MPRRFVNSLSNSNKWTISNVKPFNPPETLRLIWTPCRLQPVATEYQPWKQVVISINENSLISSILTYFIILQFLFMPWQYYVVMLLRDKYFQKPIIHIFHALFPLTWRSLGFFSIWINDIHMTNYLLQMCENVSASCTRQWHCLDKMGRKALLSTTIFSQQLHASLSEKKSVQKYVCSHLPSFRNNDDYVRQQIETETSNWPNGTHVTTNDVIVVSKSYLQIFLLPSTW